MIFIFRELPLQSGFLIKIRNPRKSNLNDVSREIISIIFQPALIVEVKN